MSDGSEFHAPDSKEENPAVTEPRDGKPDDKCSTAEGANGALSELGSGAQAVTELDDRVSQNAKSEEVAAGSTEDIRVRVSSEEDGVRAGDASTVVRFDDPNHKIGDENESFPSQIYRHNRHVQPESDAKFPGSDSKSLLSEFDEFVAAEGNGRARGGASRDLGFGFEVGDMVWGKVKSHPWWPGHIFNEAFASPTVRRTKREGHVLVAFFGDSSYGWFEPAELIPFDENFAEKSQQTYSRTFIKAVEEAVDEASRRRALGLACRCRNTDNFLPTNVQGYFSVDVPDYEPGGVYSTSQIRKARNSFKPSDTLAFVKQLALAPCDGEQESIGFSKNKATVFAYRKAVFEQYDETYAQAFGVQPLRPSHSQSNKTDQSGRQPPRAPLSGPMVIAEALGGGKTTGKSVKVKDTSKKDRYLFKRRDDSSNSPQLAYTEETPDVAGRYVLQKRAPALPPVPHNLEKREGTGLFSHDGAIVTSDAKEAVISQAQTDGVSLASQVISSDPKSHLDKMKGSSEGVAHNFEQENISSKSMGRSGDMVLPSTVDEKSQNCHLGSQIPVEVKHDGNVELLGQSEDHKQKEKGLPTLADGGNGTHQVKSENNVSLTAGAKHLEVGKAKKLKGHKRPADDLKTSAIGEKKKKKKKDVNLKPTSGYLEKHSTSGKSVPIVTKREDFQEQMQIGDSTNNLPPIDTTGDSFELPQLLGDLQALALDPFHGAERKIPAAVRQFFLRFRSLVYQKSLILSPPAENEAPEARASKSSLSAGASVSPDDHVRASPPVKPVKQIVRSDDPTKSGRKRGPSDRQEEIAAKRLKKIKHLKTLAAEKGVASQKTSETRREVKEFIPQAPAKVAKSDFARKVERPAKAVEPTILVMKFPPQTSLPSVAELKARFARFGPMDQSGFRVFWKSSTCRVVFLHKADAQAAYKYSVANQSLFGNVGVRCFLREYGDSAPEVSEAAKARADDGADEIPRVKDPSVVHRPASISSQAQQQPLPQPVIQLKSCLKKPTGEESGQVSGNGGSSKGNPRVKFMLGGEESSRGEQLVTSNRNNINNASFADGAGPTMDFNSKKVSSQPPLLPTPPATTQFMKTPQHNLNNSELAKDPRNTSNFINNTAPAPATTVDISQQMISLLTRCSDVVTNVTGLLGYVPYHPL
ncbi:PWWP domain-containing protein 1 [Arachis duranensis]|uniref:PWWP domain-containing protein 1 n=1 Tax=Arachis duranensis TaxID=130453 RepID=A0A6P4DNE0_ARADU|nr:PWWP domain-containing protein 1 [Arachis duranensis]